MMVPVGWRLAGARGALHHREFRAKVLFLATGSRSLGPRSAMPCACRPPHRTGGTLGFFRTGPRVNFAASAPDQAVLQSIHLGTTRPA